MATVTDSTPKRVRSSAWVYDLLLVLVLLAGGYLRFKGILWGEFTFMHPDERFLLMVGTDISPVKCLDANVPDSACPEGQKTWISLKDYFDTANSPLNPQNRGHSFYVYGTLPMFLTRILVELIYGHSGLDVMLIVGRTLSALFDLGTIFLVFLIGARLYSRRVGLLAAAFSTFAVLQIQQSHFFTMDTYVTFFAVLTAYFAVRVMKATEAEKEPDSGSSDFSAAVKRFVRSPLFLLSIGFGVALGLSVSSKVSSGLVAVLLPVAFVVRLSWVPVPSRDRRIFEAAGYLALAAIVSLLVFRVFQPYAFSGPGFFGLKPNPAWIDNLRELRAQTSGDVDFPPAMQWARRPIWFSWKNIVLWGLGLPLGLLAWVGFLWAGWRMLKGGWREHILLWSWTAIHFTYWSLPFNPTLRYQLPIYPTLAIFAAWFGFYLYDSRKPIQISEGGSRPHLLSLTSFSIRRVLSTSLMALVLLVTGAYAFAFTNTVYGQPFTRVAASRWIYQNIPGPINLHIQTQDGMYNQPQPYSSRNKILSDRPYITSIDPRKDGFVTEIFLPHVTDQSGTPGAKTIQLTLSAEPDLSAPLAQVSVTQDLSRSPGAAGSAVTFALDKPLPVIEGQPVYLELAPQSGSEAITITLAGSFVAVEGDWDDPLPLRVDGYDAYGGIYTPYNFNMYDDDTQAKLDRFLNILANSEYILISSSRQWGSLPRLPERFPLDTLYYRKLIGCPLERTIEWCYSVAKPGEFKGELGFDLVQIEQSNPHLGPFQINDQLAEEAFTVYDHPKVLIFKKSAAYSQASVEEILGSVDLSKVVHVKPGQAGALPADFSQPGAVPFSTFHLGFGKKNPTNPTMLLPTDRLDEQTAGGTWIQLFNPNWIQNRFPWIGLVLWYIVVALLGWVAYPIMRIALKGLPDRGYPLARITGMLVLSYVVWLAGSFRIPFTRATISVAALLMLIAAGLLAYFKRDELHTEWKTRKRYFLIVEGLFLALFLIDLLIRLGNPDLWHPWKGGEKPMDFSYFNAVLKSTTFPPYDPWFAGGYINYYYYGFVLVGVVVKWLGIVPSIAYNLILPTIFAMTGLGAFSVASNLIAPLGGKQKLNTVPNGQPFLESEMEAELPLEGQKPVVRRMSRAVELKLLIGLAATAGMVILGNLGTLRMIYQGYQQLAAPGGKIDNASVVTRWVWAARGFGLALTGSPLPYRLDDWYWIPSRAIPVAPGGIQPITEFPFFTVLYGDPHAHLFALPLQLLALAWGVSVVLGKGWQSKFGAGLSLLLGGLVIGSLRPVNTWDLPTYLAIGAVAIGYAAFQYQSPNGSLQRLLPWSSDRTRRILLAVLGIGLLAALSFALFQPYAQWYVQAYTKVDLWKGDRTPFWSYLTHWGLFLFVIVSWMVWETRDWMASTPLSSLRKLLPYRGLILSLAALLLAWIVVLQVYLEVNLAWFIILLAAWAALLILRSGQSDAKRIVLFLVGTALTLTLMVEVIVLHGDIERMNTVFKFYLQAWTLFAVSAAVSLGWLLIEIPTWKVNWRTAWQIALVALVTSAALYPVLATTAKIKDRMAPQAPHTLDGMAYMRYATYDDLNTTLDLSQDYRAIRWMQDNVIGSPVIVEANQVEYHWGTRFTVYTGLPNVIGWNWHQRQQRALAPEGTVENRIADVSTFYFTVDPQEARAFLDKYSVRYIIVGQLERALYPGPGLEKFDQLNGTLWKEVYREGQTVIYQVLNNP